MSAKNLSQQAANSAVWSGINVFSSNFLKLFTTAVLARFLSPEEFGVIGLASILVGIVTIFGQVGLNSALIYKKDADDKDLSTSFTMSTILSILLCILTILLAPLGAIFFNNELVKPAAIFMSFTFILNGLGSTNSTLITKNLEFKKAAIINVVAILFQSLAALVLVVYFDQGIYGVIYGSLIADFVALVMRVFWTHWFPHFHFDWERFKYLFKYSKNVYGSSFVSYFNSNVDYLVIGRVLDSASLGYYQFAYSLPNMAQSRFTMIVTRILFPIFCKVQDDHEKFRSGYHKTIKWISMVTFPTLLGLAMLANEFVIVVYSEKWLPIVTPLQILCISGAIRSIFYTNGSVINAKGRPDIVFQWGMLMLPVTFLSVYIGSFYGTVGVAWAMSLVLVTTIIPLRYVIGLIEMPVKMYLSAFVPAVTSTLIMGTVVLGVKFLLLKYTQNPYFLLFLLTFLGMTVYFLSLILLFKNDCKVLFSFVKSAVENKKKGAGK